MANLQSAIPNPQSKIIPLSETPALVPPNATLGLGGMTLYRRPVAFVRELIRHSNSNPNSNSLTLLAFTASYESDLLVGAGLVKRVRSCYFGLEAFGLAPMFTQAANLGEIEIIEETEASLAFGIRAALANVGFMAGRGWLGTDLPTLRPDVKTVTDPYNGETLIAYPAIHCDVAVIHALKADRAGNAIIGGNMGVDVELAILADTTIITAEEIVDSLERADIPGPAVRAVAHAPRGAWPTSCHPLYPLGGGELLNYIDACNSEGFDDYVRRLQS
ncbi:MAG: CoA transferase subunit A [Chloroflexi bacterium]|nr:CoA transferase subunit A [Chloroflexota bacterium]